MAPQSGPVITSTHNPGIRRARSLLRRKGRYEERAFLVEGRRAVADVIAAGVKLEAVYVRDSGEDRAWSTSLPPGLPVRFVSAEVLASISDVPHPQGVVAVVPMDAVSQEARHDVWRQDLVLVADGVADPGNLGTLLRTAAGAGVSLVLVSPRTVDPFNPKCVRAAMGAHFLVGVRRASLNDIGELLERIPLVAVADAAGEVDYADVDWRQPCAIVVGSEAFGPQAYITGLATAYVRVPLARNLESLNAGVAGSHLVLEAARQRRHASEGLQSVQES